MVSKIELIVRPGVSSRVNRDRNIRVFMVKVNRGAQGLGIEIAASRALVEDADGQKYIQTIVRIGFCTTPANQLQGVPSEFSGPFEQWNFSSANPL